MSLYELKQERKESMKKLNLKLQEYGFKISGIIKKSKNIEEILYIFDSTKIQKRYYGKVVYDKIFSLLKENEHTLYFSSGHYLNDFDNSEYNIPLLSFLFRDIKEVEDKEYHQWETGRYFIVVIKGKLSSENKNEMLKIENELYFIGKKNLKNYSELKWYLNIIISLRYVKTGNIVVDFNHSEWDEIFVKQEEYLNFSICYEQYYDIFNKNSKLDKREYDEDVFKELLKKYSIDISESKLAADLNFKEEIDEINLIQDMFIESKNILGEITIMSDFERELKNKLHSVYKDNGLQIERVFYLHEQLFERFLKIIYIHNKGERYLDKSIKVKKFSHDIDKVIKEIDTLLNLTEEEKEYLHFISLYYNEKRYNTFEKDIDLKYLLKRKEILFKYGVRKEEYLFLRSKFYYYYYYGIEFNIKFNNFINDLFSKLKEQYLILIKSKGIMYMYEIFGKIDYYPKNQMIDKISYKLVEYYLGNKADDRIGGFIENIEEYNQIDDDLNDGLELIQCIKHMVEEEYGEIVSEYNEKNKNEYDFLEYILKN